MNLRRGKQLPAVQRSAVWYIRAVEPQFGPRGFRTKDMPSVSRAAGIPRDHDERADRKTDTRALYRTVGPAGKRGAKLRRAAEISLTTPGLDLTTRLRVFQRALRSRIERRDALLDIVRAVNTTLEPPKIAELIVERTSTWLPAPCWAVVCADLSGQLSVLADRGLTPDMGPAVYAIATWVMNRGQEFVSADLSRDARVADPSVGAVMSFPLSCRGRRVGALVALDRQASEREPRLPPTMLRAVRLLL